MEALDSTTETAETGGGSAASGSAASGSAASGVVDGTAEVGNAAGSGVLAERDRLAEAYRDLSERELRAKRAEFRRVVEAAVDDDGFCLESMADWEFNATSEGEGRCTFPAMILPSLAEWFCGIDFMDLLDAGFEFNANINRFVDTRKLILYEREQETKRKRRRLVWEYHELGYELEQIIERSNK